MAVEVARRSSVSVVVCLFGAGVLAQVCYPLTSGTARDALTVITVLLVGAAALVHSYVSYGSRTLVVLALVCVIGGFAIEVLGVHTGVPFGDYRYTGGLGAGVFGVPVVIALRLADARVAGGARSAPVVPLLRGARRGRGVGSRGVGSVPRSADGCCRALARGPTPPRTYLASPAVPLTDYAGWLVVSVAMSLALQSVLRGRDADDWWPLVFYVWTWASSTLALAAFLDLPAAALWGGIAMGAVAVPLTRALWR